MDVISVHNPIVSNSIYGNAFSGPPVSPKGIALNASATPLANDDCDTDSGPGNDKQNYPVITNALIAAGSVTISGTLNSLSNSTFLVQFFSNVACDTTGFGQGLHLLGSTIVITTTCPGTNTPNGSFGPLVFAIPGGQNVITSTATLMALPAVRTGVRPAGLSPLVPVETSEFSACFTAAGGITPTNTPTSTPTSAPTLTPTPTPTNTPAGVATSTPTSTATRTPTQGQVPAAVVPTLTPGLLVLLGLVLAAAALFLIRRSG